MAGVEPRDTRTRAVIGDERNEVAEADGSVRSAPEGRAAVRIPGRFRGRAPDRDFDPRPEREVLLPLLRAIEAVPEGTPEPLSPEVMEPLLRAHPRPEGGFYSRSHLIAAFQTFAASEPFRIGTTSNSCASPSWLVTPFASRYMVTV